MEPQLVVSRQRFRSAWRWAYRAATVNLLLCIAWDSSSNTSALEGGRRHLSFGSILFGTLFWAVVVGAIGYWRGGRAKA